MPEYQFRVGDRVRIWDERREVTAVGYGYVSSMFQYAGMEANITRDIFDNGESFRLDIDHGEWCWSAQVLTLVCDEASDMQDKSCLEEIKSIPVGN